VDTIAHGLWAAAAGTTWKRAAATVSVRWVVWWTVFPDLLAFGPAFALGLWLRLAGILPHAHIGLPLYNIGHSLIVFAAVAGLSSLIARRLVLGLSGWLLHILIDIPTHSYGYYATRFLWPVSDYGFDGVAWWTPWLMWCTYGGLAATYLLMWRKGWLTRARQPNRPRKAAGSCG
jgi:hypothetical protein